MIALPRPRALAALALVSLGALSGGCGVTRAHKAEQARLARLERETDGIRYARPLDEVWDGVRKLLDERDYGLAGKDAPAGSRAAGILTYVFSRARETKEQADGSRVLETGWNRGIRYRAEGFPGAAGARVVFTRIEEDQTEHGRDRAARRDPELELELARRLDPEQAARIDAALAAP